MTRSQSSRRPFKREPLEPERVRAIKEGFSWIDRRFMREHAPRLSRDEILVYCFLAAVSDRFGLSFYGDATAAALLKIPAAAFAAARAGLVRADLIAYRSPLHQVLELRPAERRARPGETAVPIGEIVRALVKEGD